MKVRSLKQALHWLFLVVGLISLLLLIVSANTYFGYAKEGYGLRVSLESANLVNGTDGFWLGFDLDVKNPGKLDIDLQTAILTVEGLEYPLPTSSPYHGLSQGSYPVSPLPKGETMAVVLWFIIDPALYHSINSTGQADVLLNMEIFVPNRYCTTSLIFKDVVVT
jgi:hypothetical protein